MALMRWARLYVKPPNHLTDREYRLRKRVFWTLYSIMARPFTPRFASA